MRLLIGRDWDIPTAGGEQAERSRCEAGYADEVRRLEKFHIAVGRRCAHTVGGLPQDFCTQDSLGHAEHRPVWADDIAAKSSVDQLRK